jgi:putative ABC transport system permease protein
VNLSLHTLAYDWAIAFRNVLRQRRRTVIALSAIGFGVIALILAGGFIESIYFEMREATIRSLLGHIQVTRAGYRETGTADPFAYLLPPRSDALAAIERTPGVQLVAPRLSFSGLISHGEATISFIADGVDPKKEMELGSSIVITSGSQLSSKEPRGVIVGRGLADNLGVTAGDTVVLLANTASGGVNAVECRVRGVFSTMVKAYDDTALRVPIVLARDLLRVDGTTTWLVLLDRTDRTQSALGDLRRRIGGGFETTAWWDLADFYRKTVRLFNAQVRVMKAIIAIIILLSISNTMTMSLLERTGEIGTSMALGVKRRTILRQFLTEGALLGVAGAVFGLVVAVILAWAISAVGIPMPPPPGTGRGYVAHIMLSTGLVLNATSLAAGSTLIASFYPAWRASRLPIADALRFNR